MLSALLLHVNFVCDRETGWENAIARMCTLRARWKCYDIVVDENSRDIQSRLPFCFVCFFSSLGRNIWHGEREGGCNAIFICVFLLLRLFLSSPFFVCCTDQKQRLLQSTDWLKLTRKIYGERKDEEESSSHFRRFVVLEEVFGSARLVCALHFVADNFMCCVLFFLATKRVETITIDARWMGDAAAAAHETIRRQQSKFDSITRIYVCFRQLSRRERGGETCRKYVKTRTRTCLIS